MNRWWTSLALTLGLAVASSAANRFVDHEVLVKVQPDAYNMLDVYMKSVGAHKISEMPEINVVRIGLPNTITVGNAAHYFEQQAGISYAVPNYIRQLLNKPTDPLYAQQYSGPRMNTEFAWDLTQGDGAVVIAIIDTGVDYTHEDLTGKVIKGKDFVNGDDDPMDDHGHGTHCAGIAAANTNNGKGVAGMCWNAKILAEKVMSAGGSGSDADINAGILDAANRGADVISMSIGGPGFDQAQQDAVNYAWSKGVVVLAAAGNSNTDMKFYPAAYDNVISVGASDKNDVRADFSNYGDWVDVAAPGVGIMSTVPGNKYEAWDGTSMACPNAAGVAALMISYAGKGGIKNSEVRDIMFDNAIKIGPWNIHGRIDAYAAVAKSVPPIIDVKGPVSATMFDGAGYTGTAADLWANDTSYFKVTSRFVNLLGGVAGATVKYSYPYAVSRYQGASLTLRAFGPSTATMTVYIQKNDGTYPALKSFALTTSQQNFTVTLPKDAVNYVDANKQFTFVIRSVVPSRFGTTNYSLKLNSAILTTKTSSRITP